MYLSKEFIYKFRVWEKRIERVKEHFKRLSVGSTGKAPNICERSKVWAPAFDHTNKLVPSRTRRVVSTSLMSILPSFASFRASMARWAPPSLEKRMKPCNRELHSQHNSVKNTPSFARIFSWQTQNHKRNFSLGRLIGRLWLAQIWQLPRLRKLNVDSDQKVYYSWLFSGVTLRQFGAIWSFVTVGDDPSTHEHNIQLFLGNTSQITCRVVDR